MGTASTGMSNYVRERIVQVIAIIVKRQSIDDMGADRRQVLAEVKQLIVGGNMQVQTYMEKGNFIERWPVKPGNQTFSQEF